MFKTKCYKNLTPLKYKNIQGLASKIPLLTCSSSPTADMKTGSSSKQARASARFLRLPHPFQPPLFNFATRTGPTNKRNH